jgi:hypothetical protein
MRKYYIFRQKTKIVNVYCDYSLRRWLPYEYVCYVNGTKELYNLFNNRDFYNGSRASFGDSFEYSTKSFKYEISFWDLFYHHDTTLTRFIIVDDKGRIRDFYELTKKYKKCRNGWRYNAYQFHKIHDTNERRQSLTPVEIREIRDEYGIVLSPGRKINDWHVYRGHKYSKGWKSQSKRRKQYKPKEV